MYNTLCGSYCLILHDLPVDCILPLIHKLTYTKHLEALTHIMIMLKREKPTADLVKHLMSWDPVPIDRFVTAVLTCWINEYEDKIGDLIGSQLWKQASPASGNRKRTRANKSGTSLGALAEMTLNHLDMDNLRQNGKQYLALRICLLPPVSVARRKTDLERQDVRRIRDPR